MPEELHLCIVKIPSPLKLTKMDTSETKLNLNEERGKLKQKFASLMDNHLMFEDGRKDEIVGKLQSRLANTKSELQKIVSSL